MSKQWMYLENYQNGENLSNCYTSLCNELYVKIEEADEEEEYLYIKNLETQKRILENAIIKLYLENHNYYLQEGSAAGIPRYEKIE